ncbi:MAG: hypothetical protein WEC41_05010, partial [Dongiaceae bacterium]
MAALGEGAGRVTRNPNTLTLLSLNLLLLAFFILLVSISSFEDARVRSVIDSVQVAFRGAVVPSSGPAAVAAAESLAIRSVEAEIDALAKRSIPLTRVERAGVGEIRIELPVDALFRPGEARVDPAQAPFLRQLTAVLADGPATQRYEIDVTQADIGDRSTEVARAGAMVRALAGAGAPADGLSAGAGPGAPAGVRVV